MRKAINHRLVYLIQIFTMKERYKNFKKKREKNICLTCRVSKIRYMKMKANTRPTVSLQKKEVTLTGNC